MRVLDLARRLGVTADTVRFYTRKGFLRPERDAHNGYREYSQSDLRRLRFILGARQLGFSVDDIKQLLKQADAGKTPCPLARNLIEKRIDEIERRFADTAQLLERMRFAVEEWRRRPDREPTGKTICHLIEDHSS